MIACVWMHCHGGLHPSNYVTQRGGVTSAAHAQATQVARNITTNEMANWPRYRYLRAPDQSFANPFDRGWRSNCLDAVFPDAMAAPGVVLHDPKP